MEYPSKNDFLITFKPIYSNQGMFLDYILLNFSKNFYEVTKLKIDNMIGERVSKIISENNVLGLKNLYDKMVPNTIRKYDKMVPNTIRKLEVEVEDLKRLYMVNIFSDETNYLALVYNEMDTTTELCNYVYNIKQKPKNFILANLVKTKDAKP